MKKKLIIFFSITLVVILGTSMAAISFAKYTVQVKVQNSVQKIKDGPDSEKEINKILTKVKNQLEKENHNVLAFVFENATEKLGFDYVKEFYHSLTYKMTYEVYKPEFKDNNFYVKVKIKNVDFSHNLDGLAKNYFKNKLTSNENNSLPDAVKKIADELVSQNKFIEKEYTLEIKKENGKWKLNKNDAYNEMLFNCFGFKKND